MMAPPRTGHRGDLNAIINAAKATPYRQEADERARQRPAAPQTFVACEAWFRDAWEASLPTRSHTRGVEDGSALGSPRMSGAMHARTDHVSGKGWGVTGHDRDGRPRGMTDDGTLTRDPFLFYLEMRLRRDEPEAVQLVRWAYMGWDVDAAANNGFIERMKMRQSDPAGWKDYRTGYEALLERGIKRLWHDCQSEPVRFSVCRECRRRQCVCGQRSESQVNAEEASA